MVVIAVLLSWNGEGRFCGMAVLATRGSDVHLPETANSGNLYFSIFSSDTKV